MKYTVEYEQEDDGRWLAEVLELSGVLANGRTVEEAFVKAQALAFCVYIHQRVHGENTL